MTDREELKPAKNIGDVVHNSIKVINDQEREIAELLSQLEAREAEIGELKRSREADIERAKERAVKFAAEIIVFHVNFEIGIKRFDEDQMCSKVLGLMKEPSA